MMFDHTNFADETWYSRRIGADSTSGITRSAYSISWELDTLPVPPTAPSNLQATSTVPGRIDLTWTDNSDNETVFAIQRFDPDVTAWTSLVDRQR